MIEDIIDNRAKIKIMKLFCQIPNKKFQMIEVAKNCGISNSRASECLRILASDGLLESRKIGKGYEYKLNLSNFFSKLLFKLFREEGRLVDTIIRDFVKGVKKLKAESIVLFGSALKGIKKGSDIDFLVIFKNKLDRDKISSIETNLIDKYGFHISTTLMTENEFRGKARKGEEFTTNVIANGRVIFGKKLEDIIWLEK